MSSGASSLFISLELRVERKQFPFSRKNGDCKLGCDKEQKFHYGGQAVIEGVMMRGPKDFAIAVRNADGEIVTSTEDVEGILGRFKWLNRPLLRGTLALIDAMALGIKALQYSAKIAMSDIEKAEAQKKAATAKTKEVKPELVEQPAKPSKVNDMTIGFLMVLGLAGGMALFFLAPIFAVKGITWGFGVDLQGWLKTLIEGLIKMSIFVGYVFGISFIPDIRRVFQYHGAEHKVINTYEAGVELTVDNVVEHTKAHVRCGTSFILVVLVTSMVIFMAVPWGEKMTIVDMLMRWVYKMALLPVVAGIAYEVIRFAGGHKDSFFTRMLVAPGLLMQRITTREPEPEMIEVAIKSLQCVLDEEASHKDDTQVSAVTEE